jgi:hypothetical protein
MRLDRRTTRTRRLVLTALVLAVLFAGCGSSDDGSKDSGSSGERPTTPTRVQITAPAPNQVVGPETTLTVNLIDGKVVDRTTGPLTPDEGHIHVLLDGKLVNMAYDTSQPLTGLTPGNHTVTVEFVAVDHAPFKNAPKAAVIFSSQ